MFNLLEARFFLIFFPVLTYNDHYDVQCLFFSLTYYNNKLWILEIYELITLTYGIRQLW